jgi:hypothetical protein
MRYGQERSALEDAVVDYLRDHQGLRELNARRRQARLTTTVSVGWRQRTRRSKAKFRTSRQSPKLAKA